MRPEGSAEATLPGREGSGLSREMMLKRCQALLNLVGSWWAVDWMAALVMCGEGESGPIRVSQEFH